MSPFIRRLFNRYLAMALLLFALVISSVGCATTGYQPMSPFGAPPQGGSMC